MKITYNNTRKIYVAQCSYGEKDQVKSVGFRWDPANKLWYTNLTAVASKLSSYFDAAASAAASIPKSTPSLTPIPVGGGTPIVAKKYDVPTPHNLELMPHQIEAVNYALNRTNTLIADEMGVGKTPTAVGIINALSVIENKPLNVLIICPASLKLNWRNEVNKWSTNVTNIKVLNAGGKHNEYPIKRVTNLDSNSVSVFIANYDICGKLDLKSRTWDLLILDESHYLKGKSGRKNEIWGGQKKTATGYTRIPPIEAKRTIAMTGTPVCNKPSELWNALRALDPARWTAGDWQKYVVRYCAAKKTHFGWDTSGASNLEELNELLKKTIMIRRTKEEVLKDLPAKIRKITPLETNAEIRRLLQDESALQEILSVGIKNASSEAIERAKSIKEKSEKSASIGDDEEGEKEKEQTVVGMLARTRRLVGEIKGPQAAEYAEELLENGCESLVIFAHHKSVVTALEVGLKKYGCSKIVGETPLDRRQKAVEDFQSGKNRVFIGSITAAGTGLTLTKSNRVLFTELDWVPGNLAQAEDRCHRHGQKNSVLVEYLVYENSIDTTMIETLDKKREVINEITK